MKTKIAMVQDALTQLGEVQSEALSEYVLAKHGVKIQPQFIPVVRASIREKEMLEKFRQESKVLEEAMELEKKRATCRGKQVA